jgi:hypothetical protein
VEHTNYFIEATQLEAMMESFVVCHAITVESFTVNVHRVPRPANVFAFGAKQHFAFLRAAPEA